MNDVTRRTLPRTVGRLSMGAALITAPFCFFSGAPALAETHGYVISWFSTATHATDYKTSCPENKNTGRTASYIRWLELIGYSHEEAVAVMDKNARGTLPKDIEKKIETRAIVNGKPVSIYNYPDAVADPQMETYKGKYAWGFDLGGEMTANKFEDPATHEKIDNQLWRAVGCAHSFQATAPDRPYFEDLTWHLMIDSAPAWSLRITGDDLSRDGKVTVTLDMVTQHLKRDAVGDVLTNATYVIDAGNPRSHNVFEGEIKNGVLSIKPANLYLEGEMPFFSEISIRDTRWRVKKEADGRLAGYWGGYIDWSTYAYMYTARPVNGEDVVGLYHALKKFADASPDPKTGQNREISATWRMEAVPAFLATMDGVVVAKPPGMPAVTAKANGNVVGTGQ